MGLSPLLSAAGSLPPRSPGTPATEGLQNKSDVLGTATGPSTAALLWFSLLLNPDQYYASKHIQKYPVMSVVTKSN